MNNIRLLIRGVGIERSLRIPLGWVGLGKETLRHKIEGLERNSLSLGAKASPSTPATLRVSLAV